MNNQGGKDLRNDALSMDLNDRERDQPCKPHTKKAESLCSPQSEKAKDYAKIATCHRDNTQFGQMLEAA